MGPRFRIVALLAGVVAATMAGGAIVAFDASSRADTTLALIEPAAATVSIRSADGPFVVVSDVAVLRAGDGVRTDSSGRAVVTYVDGTAIVVGPDTDLTIDEIAPEPSFLVALKQNAGRLWYALARTLSASSRFEARTGALAAVVRAGTAIELIVEPDGATTIAVVGPAETSAGGGTVGVPADGLTVPVLAAADPVTSLTSSPTASPSPIAGPPPTTSPPPAPSETPTPLAAYLPNGNVRSEKIPTAAPTPRPKPHK